MWKLQLTCYNCGMELDEPILRCKKCQSLVSISPIKGPKLSDIDLRSMWSLNPFLPVYDKPISLEEGSTPVVKIENIKDYKDLALKLEFRNPTGSFRDRALSLIVSDAVQKRSKSIVGASTGSFSISLSAYAAKASLKSWNVLPQNLELAKIEQMKILGSNVIEMGDSVEEATAHAAKIAVEKKAYFATPETNILTIEGQKTISLELIIQMSKIENIIVPRGSGSLILSIYRGLEDAITSSWIQNYPRIFAVSLEKTKISHLAESLEVKRPFLLEEVKEIIARTKGEEIGVNAQEMTDESMKLAKKEGLFIEPASGSVLVAAKNLISDKDLNTDNTVAILTGSGINAMNIYAAQMRGKKKVVWGLSESSTTKFEILNLIAEEKANYGYAIWVALGKTQKLQGIYQHLYELEDKGIISVSKSSKKRKHFELTSKGIETIEKMRNLIDFV